MGQVFCNLVVYKQMITILLRYYYDIILVLQEKRDLEMKNANKEGILNSAEDIRSRR